MTKEPHLQRILLAIEGPDLEAGARQYCSSLLPNSDVTLLSLEEFSGMLEDAPAPDVIRILMLHADESGQLESGTPIVQTVLSSPVPVLVIRQPRDGSAPDPKISRIVVPLDGSTTAGQAIPVASDVARALNVPVRFVMVIDPSRVIPPAYAYDPEAWGMIEELRQTSHWALSQAEAAMQRDGVSVSSELLFGPINSSLAVSIGEGDLVVMTTHGPDRQGRRSRDSVARRTLIAVPQPMLVMQAERETPVIVDGFQACSWVEPLQHTKARMT